MKHLVALIVVAGSLLALAQTEHKTLSGEIRGTVTDRDGIPVSGATVYAVPQGLRLNDVTPLSVKTDRNGVYDFHGKLPLNTYQLYAQKKEEDAYPDPLDGFYADAKTEAAKVSLTENHPLATVTVCDTTNGCASALGCWRLGSTLRSYIMRPSTGISTTRSTLPSPTACSDGPTR
jgi:hypothetical protein